jgi:hypothetical protein
MSKMIELIRTHRGAIEGLPVFRVRYLVTEPPFLPIGREALRQEPLEPFASFEARAVAAAKYAGHRFVVISVFENGEAAVAETVDDRFPNKHFPTDWSSTELLVCLCSKQMNGSEPFDVTDVDLGEMEKADVCSRASERLAKVLEARSQAVQDGT